VGVSDGGFKGGSKGVHRISTSFSVDNEIVKKFNEVCKIESVNKSALIEKLIVAYIETDKKDKK
jgi:metal-responsive CopG/Arc/MetJ family transcriptional regulator